jgi:hypothetical protein
MDNKMDSLSDALSGIALLFAATVEIAGMDSDVIEYVNIIATCRTLGVYTS